MLCNVSHESRPFLIHFLQLFLSYFDKMGFRTFGFVLYCKGDEAKRIVRNFNKMASVLVEFEVCIF